MIEFILNNCHHFALFFMLSWFFGWVIKRLLPRYPGIGELWPFYAVIGIAAVVTHHHLTDSLTYWNLVGSFVVSFPGIWWGAQRKRPDALLSRLNELRHELDDIRRNMSKWFVLSWMIRS